MISKIIIIGGHIQALGIARQAHRLGVEVILYLTERFSVARWSNTVDHIIYGSLDTLEDNIHNYRDKGTLLLPTGDDALEFLNKRREKLEKDFVLGIPSSEIVNLFSDKRNTAQFAASNNIPHPQCFCPDSLDSLINHASNLTYPVVLKPSVMYTFHKQFGKKAFLCETPSELIKRASIINESYPIAQLIIQEFLCGGPQNLYSHGVYAIDGIPKAWITANRIRQNPMDFGNSTTFAIACNIPEIEEISRHILATTKYTGLAEIEFMYNKTRKRYEMLEINTRAWKWHTLSEKAGFGFVEIMLENMNRQNTIFTPSNKQTAWVERLTDTFIIAKEMMRKRMKWKDARTTYRIDKQSAVWWAKDPLPAIMYLLQSPILYFTRH